MGWVFFGDPLASLGDAAFLVPAGLFHRKTFPLVAQFEVPAIAREGNEVVSLNLLP